MKKLTWKVGLFFFAVFILPTALYYYLSKGKHNFVHLPIYFPIGVKDTVIKGKTTKDTVYHTIRDFSLISQTGDTITQKDLFDKIYVADFFFTTCQGICKDMATQMHRIQDKFKGYNGFAILSHTVNPKNDTLAVIRSYAERVNADPATWLICTGERDEIYSLGIESYKLPAQEDAMAPGGFLHSEYFVLVDKDKRIRGFYDGTKTHEVNKLIEDIKVLMAEYQLELRKNKWVRKE